MRKNVHDTGHYQPALREPIRQRQGTSADGRREENEDGRHHGALGVGAPNGPRAGHKGYVVFHVFVLPRRVDGADRAKGRDFRRLSSLGHYHY